MKEVLTTQIDFIGDIHGYANELKSLLGLLGYENRNGYFEHPGRKAFFCGDFIDRGPQIREVLQVVKAMIDNGAAYTVIGNHEYNALCYHTVSDGKPLRAHSPHNRRQHSKTMEALSPEELAHYLDWIRTLPVFHDNGNFRIVHAQWASRHIEKLKEWGVNDFSDTRFLIDSATRNSDEYKTIESVLKGEEVLVPDIYFEDKDGKRRNAYRIKWWLSGPQFCRDALFEFPSGQDRKMTYDLPGVEKGIPVFFGHYWLKDEKPVIQSANACCLDFSVAKDGYLAAYRWNGEEQLSPENFCWVGSGKS